MGFLVLFVGFVMAFGALAGVAYVCDLALQAFRKTRAPKPPPEDLLRARAETSKARFIRQAQQELDEKNRARAEAERQKQLALVAELNQQEGGHRTKDKRFGVATSATGSKATSAQQETLASGTGLRQRKAGTGGQQRAAAQAGSETELERLRREQDREYALSLQRDQTKAAEVKAERDAKEQVQRRRAALEASLPAEPAEGTGCTVVFKFPGGKSATRRFLPTELVQVLYDFCGSLGYDELRYQLCTSFPRASLDTKTITLAAADFTGRVALHCEEL
eukprot:m.148501 g.148501  ORF g.148501 m.148501 type:complete len:278 (-) comp17316_c0_seq3:140-973(-)